MSPRLPFRALLTCTTILAAACGGEPQPSDTGGTGGRSAASSGPGGAGGAAACPEGSHDEAGTCAATLDAWQPAPSIAHARDHHVTFAVDTPAGSFLYVLGGAVDMEEAVFSIERSAIAADGALGPWEEIAGTLAAVGPSVGVAGQRVLVIGGLRSTGKVSAATSLLTVGDDGAIAIAPGPEMLHPRFHHAMVREGDWLYAVGGAQLDATSQTSVERIHFDADGAGTWIEDSPLPKPRSHHALVAHDGALYAIAGLFRYDGDPFPYADKDFADILRATIADDGSLGEWTTVGQLPDVLAVHTAFVHLDQLYVVGGLEGAGAGAEFVGKVQRADIAKDGSIGAFETLSSALPIARGHCHQVPRVGAAVYSVAGAAEVGAAMKSQVEAFVAHLE